MIEHMLDAFFERTEARNIADLPFLQLAMHDRTELGGPGPPDQLRLARTYREAVAASWWLLGHASPQLREPNRAILLPAFLRNHLTRDLETVLAIEAPVMALCEGLDRAASPERAVAMLNAYRDAVSAHLPAGKHGNARDQAIWPACLAAWFSVPDRQMDQEQLDALEGIKLAIGYDGLDPRYDRLRRVDAQIQRGLAGVYHLVVRPKERMEGPLGEAKVNRDGARLFMHLRQSRELRDHVDRDSLIDDVRSIAALVDWETAAEDAVTKAANAMWRRLSASEAIGLSQELMTVATGTVPWTTRWFGRDSDARQVRAGLAKVRGALGR